jgi:hypothetical protein
MAVEIICECGKRYRVDEKLLGKRVRCKACQAGILVEAPPDLAPMELDVPVAPSAAEPVATAGGVADDVPIGEPEISPEVAGARTYASNPGLLKLDWHALLFRERGHLGIALGLFVVAIPMLIRGYALYSLVPVALAGIWLVYSLWGLRRHLAYGDVNPGIIVGEKPWRVAVYTDLTTGRSTKPAIKIVYAPMERMADGPPEIGKPVAAICLYQGLTTSDAWQEFTPLIAHLHTSKLPQIRRLMSSIGARDWDSLANAMSQVDVSKPGFYKLWMGKKNQSGFALTPAAEVALLLLIWAALMVIACTVDFDAVVDKARSRRADLTPLVEPHMPVHSGTQSLT